MEIDDLVSRNVVVILSTTLRDVAVARSAKLQQYGDTHFVLNSGALPHLSVYQAAYPAENLAAVEANVRAVARSSVPFEIHMNGLGNFWGTFVFWEAVKSPKLTALHLQLVARLNPLRCGRLLRIHQDILNDQKVPAPLRKSIEEYGNPLAGGQERPHVTLTSFKSVRVIPRIRGELGAWTPPATVMAVTYLAVAEVGPHGTCPRVLCTYPLRG